MLFYWGNYFLLINVTSLNTHCDVIKSSFRNQLARATKPFAFPSSSDRPRRLQRKPQDQDLQPRTSQEIVRKIYCHRRSTPPTIAERRARQGIFFSNYDHVNVSIVVVDECVLVFVSVRGNIIDTKIEQKLNNKDVIEIF